jgi:transmembrane sensor
MTNARDGDYSLDEIARAWLIKMRGEDAAALRDEFDAWLHGSTDHREAYRRAEQRMAALAILKTSERHGTAHAEARRGRIRKWLPWGAAATALALLIVAIGAGIPLPGQPGASSAAFAAEPLEAPRGEIRTFRLADGSSATLDTDSRIDVAVSADARSVRLVRGRVRLSVARQKVPLRIEAGPGAATANDAEIDMSLDEAGTVTASLRRGAAEVRADAEAGAATPLREGAVLAYRSDGTLAPKAAPPTGIPASWPDGWAEYRSIRLDRLVAEANRYAAAPIVIDESAIGEREVSGRFQISKTGPFAERIATLFDLRVERRADAIHLSRR